MYIRYMLNHIFLIDIFQCSSFLEEKFLYINTAFNISMIFGETI